ncbi:MAG: LPXTG cell wall anchor domain-containing protein [Acidimicrobiales bacterium]
MIENPDPPPEDPDLGPPGEEQPPCDPAVELCEELPCDPAIELCEEPACDPAMELCEGAEPCEPDTEDCGPPDGMAPPVASSMDETCVYEYDAEGTGTCYSNGMFCMFVLYDGQDVGSEACVAGAVIEVAAPTTQVAATPVASAPVTEAAGPRQLPATGIAAGQLTVVALLLIASGGLLLRRAPAARHT